MDNHDRSIARTLGAITGESSRSITVTTAETTILSIYGVPGIYRIGVKNTGATALSVFKIQGRNLDSGTWENIVTTTAQFTTATSDIAGFLLMSTTVDPTLLASNSTWYGTIDAKFFNEVQIIANVASGSTTLTVQYS